MTLLENDAFLVELNKLFHKSRLGGPGAVYVTIKNYNGRTKPVPRKPEDAAKVPHEKLCLFRATVGNNKISTVVHAKEVNKFQMAYISVLKTNADNLKKREKEKKPTAATSRATGTKAAKA
ncbi:signal recognition particle 14-like protein [Aphelenchoides avenae]|nr:signal recognition particle 14-like protein [Aphelenchus avenae]